MGGPGSGGHNKKDKGLKLLQGTYRKDRDTPAPEFDPAPAPKPPAGLSKEARELWRTITDGWALDLAALHVLKLLCETLDAIRRAERVLEAEGWTLINKNGVPVAHPEVKTWKDCRELYLKYRKALNLE
jgi:phage terminase small subunit